MIVYILGKKYLGTNEKIKKNVKCYVIYLNKSIFIHSFDPFILLFALKGI
ncbi:unknown protein [Paenibacillus amylolyticus]|uniref:Uncharacterized protein n=1 Tax=Paenibacillus amylolyticus TaxID=1451 RepID=A0A100VLK6_PAEAM|nr:unknown protein [Paenibacillus amylolyticus]